MFWSTKTPCVSATRHHFGSHLMVPLICLTHQQSKVWWVGRWDSPSQDPPSPKRASGWELSENLCLVCFLFATIPWNFTEKRAFPTPPIYYKASAILNTQEFIHPRLFLANSRRGLQEGGPTTKTQQRKSLLTVYHAKTGCRACHCT